MEFTFKVVEIEDSIEEGIVNKIYQVVLEQTQHVMCECSFWDDANTVKEALNLYYEQ